MKTKYCGAFAATLTSVAMMFCIGGVQATPLAGSGALSDLPTGFSLIERAGCANIGGVKVCDRRGREDLAAARENERRLQLRQAAAIEHERRLELRRRGRAELDAARAEGVKAGKRIEKMKVHRRAAAKERKKVRDWEDNVCQFAGC